MPVMANFASMYVRTAFCLLAVLVCCPLLNAQSVRHKHLITSLGGGVGMIRLTSSLDSLGTTGIEVGNVRFACAFALGDQWSLGFHYDRIGTDRYPAPVDRIRFTTYMLEGSWRPWTGSQASLEVLGGFGMTIMSMLPSDARIAYKANGGVVSVGARYLHLLSGTLGLYIAADHVVGAMPGMTLDDQAVLDKEGEQVTTQWSSPRLSIGMFVRF